MDKDPKNNEDGEELSNGAEILENEADNFNPEQAQKAREEREASLEQEKSGKVGEVYGKIAKEALMKWNGMSEEEADEKIAGSSLEELESMIGAKGSVEAACKSIAKRLDTDAEKLSRAVIYGENSDTVFGDVAEKMPQDYEFVIETLSDVHDQWVKDNEKKFFDPVRQDRIYQFMPLSLIGVKEAKSDLLFVEPILRACGNKNDLSDKTFDDEYQDWAYWEDNSTDRNIMCYDVFGDTGYPLGWGMLSQLLDDPKMVCEACPENIVQAIKNNNDLALKITEQVIVKMGNGGDLDIFEEEVAWLAEDDDSSYEDDGEDDNEEDDLNNNPYFTSQEYINDGWD